MKRRLTVLATVVVLAASGFFVAAYAMRDETEEPATETTSTQTVAVERRTLKETGTVSGELGYDESITVSAGVSGGVLTWLPTEGAVVRRGKAAYRVNDEPVVLLIGKLPLYRTLSDGVDGADVKQLEQNLEKLGYDPGTVDESFTSYTEAAVEDLQEDLGLEETGVVTADSFTVLPGELRVGTPSASIGTQLQPGATLYAATSTHRVISVDLDPADEELAVKGAKAEVTLPNGRTTRATVASVGTVATSTGEGDTGDGSDPSAEATIPVTLTLDKPQDVARLSAAPVTVDLTRTTRKDVLVVPVTSLVALAEGGFAVRREGGALAAVEPGLYADGQVEILSGLAEGDRVEVPSS
jgi:peptidoglycan hydrolase-like protein with peptidoglycan-binding domain